MWTRFMDMHSGGGQKEKWAYIYIELPEDEAKVVFYNRFGHNPERVTCTCCGEDYSISSKESLEQLSAYDRNCEFGYFFEDTKELAATKWNGAEYNQKIGKWCVDNRPVEGRYMEEMAKMTIEEYFKSVALMIKNSEIKPEEESGDIPQQGYVWVG